MAEMTKTKIMNLHGADEVYLASEIDEGIVAEINAFKEGDLTLVGPTLSGTWTVVDQSNSPATPENNKPAGGGAGTDVNLNGNAITIETGFKASWAGNYKWTTTTNRKNPETYSTNGFAETHNKDTAPESGTNVALTVSQTTSNKSASVTQYSPKKGLMASGSIVIAASGEDSTSANVSVTFTHRRYWGLITNNNPTESDIKNLQSELSGGRGSTKSFSATSGTQYITYCYVASLGDLSGIIMDGATPVLGAFTKLDDLQITNDAGASITLRRYVSNNPGAFPNGASLAFS